MEITLCQEYTKAAHASIRYYIETLRKFRNVIFIECWLTENRLTVPIRAVIDELKAPVFHMLKNDKVRFTPEETEDINEQLNAVIEGLLRVDEIFKKPVIFQFSKLINNEPVNFFVLFRFN